MCVTQGIVVVSTFVAVTAILKAAVRWIDDWKVRTAPEVGVGASYSCLCVCSTSVLLHQKLTTMHQGHNNGGHIRECVLTGAAW